MSQEVQQVSSEPSEEFWRSHIVAASQFNGSNSQYCRDHGLSHKTFSVYKVKLGLSRAKGRPKSFVEVKPRVVIAEKPKVQTDSKRYLPDAKWVAEFVTALGNQR